MKRAVTYMMTFALGTLLGVSIERSVARGPELSTAGGIQTQSQTPTASNSSVESPVPPTHGSGKNETSRNVDEPSRQENINTQKEEFEKLFHQDDFDGAATVVQRMEATASHSRQFLESKSRLLVRQREWEGAKVVLTQCLELFPASKACWIDLASTELQVGSREEQEKAVASCLTVMPNDPQCRNILAMVKMNQGKYGDAVSVYRQLIKDNGSFGMRFDEAMLNWQLAVALEGLGNFPESATYFDKACRSNFASACKKYEEVRAKM